MVVKRKWADEKRGAKDVFMRNSGNGKRIKNIQLLSNKKPKYLMKTSIPLFLFLLILFTSCQSEKKGPQEIEINAFDYAFAAPDTIPAGWTRFKMTNHGEEEHFMLIRPLSDGLTKSDLLGAAE